MDFGPAHGGLATSQDPPALGLGNLGNVQTSGGAGARADPYRALRLGNLNNGRAEPVRLLVQSDGMVAGAHSGVACGTGLRRCGAAPGEVRTLRASVAGHGCGSKN